MDHLALSDDNLAYVGETGACECSETTEEEINDLQYDQLDIPHTLAATMAATPTVRSVKFD